MGKSNHFAAVFCLMKDWEQTLLRLPNIPKSKYLPKNTDLCSIFVLFFNACTFVSQKDTHIAWQSLWSSMLSVSTYVPDSNNAPCFISSSSFPPWQTRLVFAVINPAELKIDKWFSSSENWQNTLFMFPISLQVMVNIIQPNYILIFPLIENQPNWEK